MAGEEEAVHEVKDASLGGLILKVHPACRSAKIGSLTRIHQGDRKQDATEDNTESSTEVQVFCV